MVLNTVFVTPLITDILLSVKLGIYTRFVNGLTATETGSTPTDTFVITVFVIPSIIVTLLLGCPFATYITFVIGFTPIPLGVVPVGTVVIIVFVIPSITDAFSVIKEPA
ncbi:hypothetical protein D3C73_1412890 [compost metagenome]